MRSERYGTSPIEPARKPITLRTPAMLSASSENAEEGSFGILKGFRMILG